MPLPTSHRQTRTRQRHNLPLRLQRPRHRRIRSLLLRTLHAQRPLRRKDANNPNPRTPTTRKTSQSLRRNNKHHIDNTRKNRSQNRPCSNSPTHKEETVVLQTMRVPRLPRRPTLHMPHMQSKKRNVRRNRNKRNVPMIESGQPQTI